MRVTRASAGNRPTFTDTFRGLEAVRMGLIVGAVAAAAIGGVVSAAQPVLATGGSANAGSTPASPAMLALVERGTCAHPTGASPPPNVSPGETFVSFDVAGTVRLRIDGSVVTAASTNTGCHPRPGDMVIVADDDGLRSASPAEVAVALTDFGTGDWRTPGAWHTR